MPGQMLIAIVQRGQASRLMQIARDMGATGGTIANARGTASNAILASLGLGDSKREILFSMLPGELSGSIFEGITKAKAKGVAIMLDSKQGAGENGWEMVQVICEDGYADDIMDAARKAGAPGGSIVNAHGTASEDDVRFFGYPLVAEKQMIFIIVRKGEGRRISDAIRGLDCLQKKGAGIVFTLPVSDFHQLGS